MCRIKHVEKLQNIKFGLVCTLNIKCGYGGSSNFEDMYFEILGGNNLM